MYGRTWEKEINQLPIEALQMFRRICQTYLRINFFTLYPLHLAFPNFTESGLRRQISFRWTIVAYVPAQYDYTIVGFNRRAEFAIGKKFIVISLKVLRSSIRTVIKPLFNDALHEYLTTYSN